METAPTLICIPDISGFTKFVSDVDIELAAKVIPSLLNNVISTNKLGLKVSEIEGDAVLFYKTGPLPKFEDLIHQMRKFYTEFYKQLIKLNIDLKHKTEGNEIEDTLGLKIVLHYGKKIGAVFINKTTKLIGEDVIIAHRLLKNTVPLNEYLLVSQTLLDEYSDEKNFNNFPWGKLIKQEEEYKYLGDVDYSYVDLKPLVED